MTQYTPKKNYNQPSKLNCMVRNFSLLLCLGMLAGILIWSKLRLVTDIPRSAYADPRETQVETEIDPVDLLLAQPFEFLREESEAQESEADVFSDEFDGLIVGEHYSEN